MTKITFLGTGAGGVVDTFNTSFIIENNGKLLLVDTGGGPLILKQLKNANISLNDIKNVFISHSHTDHILGAFWMMKKLGAQYINAKISEPITFYGNYEVINALKDIAKYVLPQRMIVLLDDKFLFKNLDDGDIFEFVDLNFNFFDIKARGNIQYGFETQINDKKLVFLGDETMNDEMSSKVLNADYVMHEAFCLDRDADIFKPYEKNHATAKTAAIIAEENKIKNLILYHAVEETDNRKESYIQEAKQYFSGNVLIPLDLEIIEIK